MCARAAPPGSAVGDDVEQVSLAGEPRGKLHTTTHRPAALALDQGPHARRYIVPRAARVNRKADAGDAAEAQRVAPNPVSRARLDLGQRVRELLSE